MVGNSTGGGHHDCESGCSADWCLPLGVIIHVAGSVGINIGQNLQALGLAGLEAGVKPHKSRTWVIGMGVFIVASIITFGALSLASASILVPLESIQFIVNIMFGKFVRKKVISMKMYFGTFVLISGITIIVVFGPKEGGCFTLSTLRQLWFNGVWIAYFIATFAVAAVMYVVWRWYCSRKAAGSPLPYDNYLAPIAFTVSSALFGGGQMIVHSKLLAELLELTAASGEIAFADGFFWLELLLTALFGVYWLFRLSQCLGLYEPLFIIPLMQTGFIVFGAIAGGIFYKEFDELLENSYAMPLYILGILTTIFGLTFLAGDVDAGGAAEGGEPAQPAAVSVEMPASGQRVGDPKRGPRRRSLKHAVTMPISKLMPHLGDGNGGGGGWFGGGAKSTQARAVGVDVTSASNGNGEQQGASAS